MPGRIVVTVISDLVTDYRVHKICRLLAGNGYSVSLIGCERKGSPPLPARGYPARRIRPFFSTGLFFFIEFNVRLFFHLLFTPADVFLGNDLDVMAATGLAARLRSKKLVYDSHEYFLGMTGLSGKVVRKSIWRTLEKWVVPRTDYMYTVSSPIAEHYSKTYGIPVFVVRNLPDAADSVRGSLSAPPPGLPARIPGRNRILYQGAGLNEARGVEELVAAMALLDPSLFELLIVGGGDQMANIRALAEARRLTDRIIFLPRIPFEQLPAVTRTADLGISIDKASNFNQRIGLPNKIFEYLFSGVPVLVSRLPEQEKVVHQFEVGRCIDVITPENIARTISGIFEHPAQLKKWVENTSRVKDEMSWAVESKIVTDIFEQVCRPVVN